MLSNKKDHHTVEFLTYDNTLVLSAIIAKTSVFGF